MTLLDIVTKATPKSRVSVVKRATEEFIIDSKTPADLLDSIRFQTELSGIEVYSIEVGDLCDLVVTVE